MTPPRIVPASAELFVGLDGPAVQAAAQVASAISLSKGESLFDQGEPARTCYVVLEGRIKLSQITPEGNQVVVHFIGPGEMLAVAAMFAGMGYPGNAMAVQDCTLLGWDKPAITRLMERYPKIALNTLEVVGKRFQALQARYSELATERVERRIARAVLRLARQAGRKVEDGVLIDFPISRQDIAEMTGATLHTVSRTMSAWESQGLVESGRQRIVIRQPHGLVKIAEEL
jgi:CRP-like cAMP-binding protein